MSGDQKKTWIIPIYVKLTLKKKRSKALNIKKILN